MWVRLNLIVARLYNLTRTDEPQVLPGNASGAAPPAYPDAPWHWW